MSTVCRSEADRFFRWVKANLLADLALRQFIYDDSIDQHDDHVAAEKSLTEFRIPVEHSTTRYTWVVQYAKDMYQQLNRVDEQLDSKADSIIRYLGGGASLITGGILFTASQGSFSAPVVISALIPIGCAIFAMAVAVRARRPTQSKLPPTIDGAFKYANYYDEKSDAEGDGSLLPSEVYFAMQWHLTCAGLRIRTEMKARFVRVAINFYMLAVCSLLLPLVVIGLEVIWHWAFGTGIPAR
ncbi:hypothetical protein [Bremerella volcania]|nr:hypothetical protein [Bremerella volcania]